MGFLFLSGVGRNPLQRLKGRSEARVGTRCSLVEIGFAYSRRIEMLALVRYNEDRACLGDGAGNQDSLVARRSVGSKTVLGVRKPG